MRRWRRPRADCDGVSRVPSCGVPKGPHASTAGEGRGSVTKGWDVVGDAPPYGFPSLVTLTLPSLGMLPVEPPGCHNHGSKRSISDRKSHRPSATSFVVCARSLNRPHDVAATANDAAAGGDRLAPLTWVEDLGIVLAIAFTAFVTALCCMSDGKERAIAKWK